MAAFQRRAGPDRRCTPRWSATTPAPACTAGSTRSGRTGTSAGATGSRSTRTSSSCSTTPTGQHARRTAGRAGGRAHRAPRWTTSCGWTRSRSRRSSSADRRCRWSRTSSCSRRPASPGRSRTRSGCRTATSGPARRASATSSSSSGATCSGWRCSARTGQPYTVDDLAAGLAPSMKAGAQPGRRATPGRAPHHQGPGASGRPAGQALLAADPANAAALDTIETRAVLRLPGGPRAGRHAGGLRPAAARRQRQPVVRQGGVVHRLRRRPGRHQRGALRAGRHDDPGLRRHAARPPAAQPASRRAAAGACRPSRRSSSRSTPTLRADIARRRRVVRRLRRRHRHHHGVVRRLRHRAGQGAGHVAGRASRRWPTSWPTSGPRGFIGATYESIATRQWQHGRTEAMRVVTPEVLPFVATMDDPARRRGEPAGPRSGPRPRRTSQRAKECQAGEAPEQHLWELLLIQRPPGRGARGDRAAGAVPDARAGSIMRDDYLEHQLGPVDHIQYFGFGSTSSHCIGIAYVLLPRPVQPLPEHAAAGGRPDVRVRRPPAGRGTGALRPAFGGPAVGSASAGAGPAGVWRRPLDAASAPSGEDNVMIEAVGRG